MKKTKTKKSASSRRSFLKQGVVASSIFIVPRSVLGGAGYTAPSDQLNLAAIGAGGKGRSDILNAYPLKTPFYFIVNTFKYRDETFSFFLFLSQFTIFVLNL